MLTSIATDLVFEGKNSRIYLSKNTPYSATVIVKVLNDEFPHPKQVMQFNNEFEFTKNLRIRGVRKAYEKTKINNRPALYLEYIQGKSLKKIINAKKLTLTDFFAIATQASRVLADIHKHNIIHKDINSNNILFNNLDNQVTVIDFGISSRVKWQKNHQGNPEKLAGTLPYISPEQTGRMNRIVDYRTDLYSLGITLYELITGQLPFPYEDPIELIHAHIALFPNPPIDLIAPNIKQEPVDISILRAISTIICKLLAKNAEDRYQSASGLRHDLLFCQKAFEYQQAIPKDFKLGNCDFSGELQIQQKLYGREKEIKTLLNVFTHTSQGNNIMLLLEGSSGVGKSALVHELHKTIISKRGYFIEGKFDPLSANTPYHAFIQAFRAFVDILLTEREHKLAVWRKKILKALDGLGNILVDVVPDLELIIGPQPKIIALEGIEQQNRFHYVLHQFINVISQPEHPLVIFLDDLHWIDETSLELLKTIINNEANKHLLIIGAYRKNEVAAQHPLQLFIKEILTENYPVRFLGLHNLSMIDTVSLISDTLQMRQSEVNQLTKIVYRKTQGNPFFIQQFLHSLYEKKLLSFDFETHQWQWNIQAIAKENITDNVIELMKLKVLKLPLATQHILQLAACIGNKFELNILQLIFQKNFQITTQHLWPAIIEGLIITNNAGVNIDNLDKQNLKDINLICQFVHEKVREATYILIPEAKKKEIHFQIGQILWKSVEEKELDTKIFDIVHQLNLCSEAIPTIEQKTKLAQLNLKAAQKVKQSAAYQAGVKYLDKAGSLLPLNHWKNNYSLSFQIYKEWAEIAYLMGNFEYADILAQLLLQYAKSTEEKIAIYNLLIVQKTMQAHNKEVIEVAKEALLLLNIELPTQDSLPKVIAEELKNIDKVISKKAIFSLINEPVITDNTQKLIVKTLTNTIPACYMVNPQLWTALVLKLTSFLLKNGRHPATFAYSCYGLILMNMGKQAMGYQFSSVALNISRRFKNQAEICKASMMMANLCLPWVRHIKHAASINKKGFEAGLKGGEAQYNGYIISNQLRNKLFAGKSLTKIKSLITQKLPYVKRTRNQITVNIIKVIQIILAELQENYTNKLDLITTGEEIQAECIKFNDMNTLCDFFILKIQNAYIFDDITKAFIYIEKAKELANYYQGQLLHALYTYYYSLCLLQVYPTIDEDMQATYLAQVEENQHRLKQWADNCSDNFKALYLTVEGKKASLTNNIWQAFTLYNSAIKYAQKSNFGYQEAIAHELIAELWAAQGQESYVRLHLTQAIYRYQQWGIVGKEKAIKEKYPDLININKLDTFKSTTQHTRFFSQSTSIGSTQGLSIDLNSIVKASQAISSEIMLEKMLEKMMSIITENAGAENAFLLLYNKKKLFIKATCAVDQFTSTNEKEIRIYPKGISIIKSDLLAWKEEKPLVLCKHIVNYVARTKETSVLANVMNDSRFNQSALVRHYNPKSVLCMPILKQGALIGILYLSNNLVSGAFSDRHVKTLKLLLGQIAISIENALLYDNLEQKVIERTKEIQLQKEKIEEQNRLIEEKSKYKEEFFANVSHELRTPLNGILGMSHLLMETSLNDKQYQFVEVVKGSADNLLVIINDLLDMSKLNAGKLQLVSKPFATQSFFANLYRLVNIKTQQKGLNLIFNLAPDIPAYLLGDKVRIYQILINLLNNATKFTNKGKVALKVKVKKKEINKIWLQYQVMDTGIGIPEEKITNIFESFTQVIDNKGYHYNGTGLGLTIVRQLIALMNGEIKVESKLNEGTTFTFDICLAIPNQQEIEELKTTLKQTIEEKNWSTREVLIIEDNPANQLYARNLFEKWKLPFQEAVTIQEAKEHLKKKKFDCILADVHLPDGSGIDCIKELQQNAFNLNQQTPVIILTAGTSNVLKEQLNQLKLSGSIIKPFNPNTLSHYLTKVFADIPPNTSKSAEASVPSPSFQTLDVEDYLKHLSKMVGGKRKYMLEMIDIFLGQTAEVIECMELGLQSLEWKYVHFGAHKIKSTINIIGLDKLKDTVLKIEDYTYKKENLHLIPDLFTKFCHDCNIEIQKLKVARESLID